MDVQKARATEIAALARQFRQRAAETKDGNYRKLMLRTAGDLEALLGRTSPLPDEQPAPAD